MTTKSYFSCTVQYQQSFDDTPGTPTWTIYFEVYLSSLVLYCPFVHVFDLFL